MTFMVIRNRSPVGCVHVWFIQAVRGGMRRETLDFSVFGLVGLAQRMRWNTKLSAIVSGGLYKSGGLPGLQALRAPAG
jgi:hypothetical protein